jgi:carbamoylphosphate synthase large subunit
VRLQRRAQASSPPLADRYPPPSSRTRLIFYPSYNAIENESPPSERKKILVLGSGAYRIGSSVEFDWCCVSAVRAAAELGYETLMLNYNPETVSTDWDECDRLVFDEVSYESVLDLWESEKPEAIIVSMGGQVPNNLALRLARAGVKILGTSAESIDNAEDRGKFSALLDKLKIDQPAWTHLKERADATESIAQLGGYPVLVRPSYVLSGAAMSVAHDPADLDRILERARTISSDYPVVVSKFETGAREIEVDAVADQGKLVLWAICEHVEDAGVHSGDATLMLPPQTVPVPVIHKARKIAAQLAEALAITGPFNVQLLAKHGRVRVIECNLRASRSLPFVSKVTGTNFVRKPPAGCWACASRSPTARWIWTVWRSRCRSSASRGWWAPLILGVEMAAPARSVLRRRRRRGAASGAQRHRRMPKGVLPSLAQEREVLVPRGSPRPVRGAGARALRHPGTAERCTPKDRLYRAGQGPRRGGAAWM